MAIKGSLTPRVPHSTARDLVDHFQKLLISKTMSEKYTTKNNTMYKMLIKSDSKYSDDRFQVGLYTLP